MRKKLNLQSAFFRLRITVALALCLTGVFLALDGMGSGAGGADSARTGPQAAVPSAGAPDVIQLIGPVFQNQDLRTLPYVAPTAEAEERVLTRYPHGTGQTGASAGYGAYAQQLFNRVWRPAPTMPGPLLTFEGGAAAQFCPCAPPDSDGDVGPNHYVEALNVAFKIFDKNGNALAGPTTYNSFFAPLTGTPCANSNNGDPYVLYDHLADRWLISDFAFPAFPGTSFWQCVGVSQSPDPVAGPWTLYAIQIDSTVPAELGDYPKFAMWDSGGSPAQNAYFFTVNLFTSPTTFVGVRAFALDRASMLSGGPANAIAFTVPLTGVGDSYSFVAATFRTGTAPPAGRNEMLLAIDSPSTGGVTLTQVHARFFHVDFGTPANSTLGVGATHTPDAEITVTGFIDAFTDGAGFTIVPQVGTTQEIQTLGDKIMTPMVYQNRSGTESLWTSNTVCTDAPCAQPTGVRWYQFNVTGGTFPATPVQQQTWTNGNDGLYRFMPSIAVDNAGNAAIGYSTSSSTAFPGIRYAGRLASDPSNDLSQGEATMFSGTGSQTGTNGRWGDYSMTTVDPSDGMSFWHVNEYEAATGSFNWHTRIGKFNFVATPTISTTASAATVVGGIISDAAMLSGGSNPTGTITFKLYGPNDSMCGNPPVFTSTVTVNGNGSYTSGSYTPTAPGTYHWIASYSGDANNNAVSGNCGDANESVVVSKVTPNISTTASGPTNVGGSISDTATISGGLNPTGSVTFQAYGPNDSMCGSGPVFTSTVPVNGNGNYTSFSFTANTAGTYHWIASYTGDANNNAVSGSCGDMGESSVVNKLTPTLSTLASPNTTHLGATVTDTATVSGGFNPTGTVTFQLFGPNQATCGGAPVFTSTKTLSGGSATSDPFVPATPGTYRWVATYNGDANNNPVVGMCNAANESVVVLPAATSVTGSGTINSPFGGSASFIVNAQFKNGGPKISGNIDYSDPNAGFRLTQTKITSMVFTVDCVHITGTAKLGRRTRVSFIVDACDIAPPGTDSFAISISNGYSASGNVTSGQITFH